ncbi:MAG TPA: L-threonine 3-dehydrogenase, partial [Candidatus Acidoferrales bacterium]|nr:L-threonine 3-dehydrogenase [Candidatus Acidoferrales bacterium]
MPIAKMQALRKPRPEPGAQIESVDVPAARPGEVLVRVRAASICGTDLHIYHWDAWSASRLRPPLTFGHEFCGVVEAVGEGVTGFAPGDRVTAEMHVACGHCRPCRAGEPHVCQNVRILGIDQDGCFAEFVRIPAGNLWKLDAAIPEHYAAIMDPLGNAVHSVLAGPIAGATVGVTGCGPIGLMSIVVAKACGCSTLFATEISPHRAKLAREMGADLVLNPKETDAVARVRAETDGAGVDVLLEMSGNPAAIRQGLKMLRPGGRASLLGIPSEPVTLDLLEDVIFKGATVLGIYGRHMFETWLQMSALLRDGKLNLEPLFKERLRLGDYA